MNSITTRYFTDKDQEAWDDYVKKHPDSTFFHLSKWKKVVEESFYHKSYYFLAEQGDTIKGIFPLFHIKSIVFGNSLVSMPFVVYGGICADDMKIYDLLSERSKKLARELGVDYLEFRNVKQHESSLPTKQLYFTFKKEIFEVLDENMAAIPRKQRRMIKQGIKNGLQSRIGNEYMKEFYNILARSYQNLGSPIFPLKFFEKIMYEFGDDCRILSIWHNGKIVGAVMTFFFKDVVMPYFGGALKESFRYAVNDFMYWELMKYGCENGFKIFDFGRSKKGTGSYNFKRHWGFDPEPLPYQYYLVKQKEIPNISPANPKFSLLISCWKKMPLTVTKIIGPMIVKYIP